MNSDLKKRNAEVLKKWLDGAEIQVRPVNLDTKWYDVVPYSRLDGTISTNSNHYEYRLKPGTVKFRTALFKELNGRLYAHTYNGETKEKDVENLPLFFRWFGDWQEVSADDPNS